MLLNVSTRRTWIPDLLNNNEAVADQQIRIDYDKPNAVNRNAWQRRVATYRGDGSTHAYTETDVRGILSGSNVVIHNLTIRVGTRTDQNGKEVDDLRQVTTGEQLAETRSDYCFLLAAQLAQRIMEVEVSSELLKNSEPDSGPVS